MEKSASTNRLILIADILGFSNIVRNLNGEELTSRIKDWTDLVDGLSKKYDLKEYQLLSDTLFLICEYNEKNIKALFALSRDLLTMGIEKSIPIKGAISYGEVYWGKLIYGKAVIDAHYIEIEQNWIGITCSSKVLDIQTYYGQGLVICYPPCFKSGKFTLMPVVNWDPPRGDDLFKKIVTKGLMKEGEQIESKIVQMVDNTNTFRLYKHNILNVRKLKTDQYHGTYHTNFLD
jgi:hypothetical protein